MTGRGLLAKVPLLWETCVRSPQRPVISCFVRNVVKVTVFHNYTLNHRTEIRSGVLADQSAQLLTDFFQAARIKSKRVDD